MIYTPLIPKNPKMARVLIMGRISTVHQNMESIEASYRYAEEQLKQIYQGPIEIKHLGERASGMRTDRVTIIEAQDDVATGTWDLVISEDLGRLYRNPRYQYAFVQDAVDNDTRVICFGDNLDTADENWEVNMGTASLRHGLHIPDTRRRVVRTATHSFHTGGMVMKTRFGYRKLTKNEAESGAYGPKGLKIAKMIEMTPILQQMKAMVMSGKRFAEVADWLSSEAIDPGPYVVNGKWNGKVVEGLLRDPILSGTRTFRKFLHRPRYGNGGHRRQRNPNGPLTEYYPELAHFTPEEHQELIAYMDAVKRERGESQQGRSHPLSNRTRSTTLWPGQHMRCATCNGLMYWADKKLKCQNAFERGADNCWNHVEVSPEQARDKVLAWLISKLDQDPQFRPALIDAAWDEYLRTLRRSHHDVSSLDGRIRDLERRAGNIANAIANSGQSPTLLGQLKLTEESLSEAQEQKRQATHLHGNEKSWASKEELAAQLDQAVTELARTSFAFGDLLRRIIPRFVIQPVQALDSGLVRPRAILTLRLSALSAPTTTTAAVPENHGDIEVTLDLFDPPVHIKHMAACLSEKAKTPRASLKKIAKALQINHMTVKRAFDYARRMQREGLQEPYRVLQTKPANASRWRSRAPKSPGS